MITVHAKRYQQPERAAAAHSHLQWLASLNAQVRLPRLQPSSAPDELVTEHLAGHHPGPTELVPVAAALGRLHGRAHATQLHDADLGRPFRVSDTLTIPDFLAGRADALMAEPVDLAGLPVAIYKDTNCRNVLLDADTVALLDFDDLTLAPFGYDLAKLIVSTAMTHGRIDLAVVDDCLYHYNHAVETHGGPPGACTQHHFNAWTRLHHQLTAAYLGRNGYSHPWPDASPFRPHPDPDLRRNSPEPRP